MRDQDPVAAQLETVRGLCTSLAQTQGRVQIFETHISWVLVAGDAAYKIKKAAKLDFLDFSTLQARRHYCEEELRLNRRLAPELYLAVVPIGGGPDCPQLEGAGTPFEYAVKMRAFSQDALWSARLRAQVLSLGEVDEFARLLGRFHLRAEPAPEGTPWGGADLQQGIAEENARTVAQYTREPRWLGVLAQLRAWERAHRVSLDAALASRKAQGCIRECHGDLHAANILTLGGRVQVFDCIEFNEAMRWIDVFNDIAFTCMDLRAWKREDLAARLLDRYLEETGDFGGLAVLPHYLVQRALVRCKVALLRAEQYTNTSDEAEHRACRAEAYRYLDLALKCTRLPKPMIVIMHGMSGSGKSTLSGRLMEGSAAVRLRSDVERKRMYRSQSDTAAPDAPYSAQAVDAVYVQLAGLARQIVLAGYPVIVDAAFLKQAQRRRFEELAAALGLAFCIVSVQASVERMQARVAARAARGDDPSDAGVAVLARQLEVQEPLTEREADAAIRVDFDGDDMEMALQGAVPRVLDWMRQKNAAPG